MTVKQEFMADLYSLVKKWDATIEASDHYQGYPECGEDIYIEIDIPAIYTHEGETLREYTCINIGRYINKETLLPETRREGE